MRRLGVLITAALLTFGVAAAPAGAALPAPDPTQNAWRSWQYTGSCLHAELDTYGIPVSMIGSGPLGGCDFWVLSGDTIRLYHHTFLCLTAAAGPLPEPVHMQACDDSNAYQHWGFRPVAFRVWNIHNRQDDGWLQTDASGHIRVAPYTGSNLQKWFQQDAEY